MGERPFQWSVQQGGGKGEVDSAIWRRETQRKEKNRREEQGGKREAQWLMSTHLMLPAGRRDADGTVLLIHPPSFSALRPSAHDDPCGRPLV